MAGREEREAIEVDRLIRTLHPADRRSTPHPVLSVGGRALPRVNMPMRAGAVRLCVALGVMLGAAIPQWPYPRECGWWLLLYSMAVAMVVIAGTWGATLSWARRLGFTHTIALGTVLWGLVLAAQVVLPRVGYAKASADWFCG